MIDSFTKRLTSIKNELLALKTAHQHGLGTMRLWRYEVEKPSTDTAGDVTITIEIPPDSPPFPFVDVKSNNPNYVDLVGMTISNDGRRIEYIFGTWANAKITFIIVMSCEALSINTQWGTRQWIG